MLVDACCWAGVLSATPRLRQPGATVPPQKLARNFPRSVFDVPRKRWNCNDPISKFERHVGELRATFVGNHAGVRGAMWVRVGGSRCAGASGCGYVARRGGPRAGRGQPVLPENSHVISLGQFLMCLENVGIATTRFQSLKDRSGNYVRHLWGTMRMCGEPCGCVAISRAGRPRAGRDGFGPRRRENGSRVDKAGPASVGTRGLARSREAATPRSAARSRSRTVRGRRLVSRAR